MAEINDWFTQHGSVVSAETEKDPADKYGTLTRYKFEDGSELVVRPSQTDPETGESTPQEIVERKLPGATKKPVEGDTAAERQALELEKQRRKNAALPIDQDPAYETDAERAARARQTRTDQEAEARRRELADAAEQTRTQAETQRKATTVKEQHTDADGTEWTQYEDGHWVNRGPSLTEQRQAAQFNRPQIISAPPGQRKIAQQDNEGNITSVNNPNFDQAAYDRTAAKEQAQAERDRLALQIEAGKLTEATAAAQYKRWFDENVTLPIQRAQEARARAAELRQAQEAEDRRQQFAANYEQQRQTTAISAGNQAANAFNSNLQYQVGPKFGEQFAGALNSLQGGPPQQFTADAFTFKGPSIEAVARKATAKALAGISPYAQAIATAGQRDPQVASYDQSMTPAAIAPSAPPPQGTPPDYAGIINQYLQNNPYVPGGGDQEDQ